MKILNCPLNGPRNIQEFVYGGEVTEMPNAAECTDDQWAEFVFFENNRQGIVREWWCHVPTNYWFIAERNTANDEFLKTYTAEKLFGASTSTADE